MNIEIIKKNISQISQNIDIIYLLIVILILLNIFKLKYHKLVNY